MIQYMHDIAGRLRVRCPLLRKDVEKMTEVKENLESTCGVESVAFNAVTGSFTIFYDSARTTSVELLAVLDEHGCRIDDATPAAQVERRRPRPVAVVRGRALSAQTPEIAKAVAGFVIERAIERSLIALVAAVL